MINEIADLYIAGGVGIALHVAKKWRNARLYDKPLKLGKIWPNVAVSVLTTFTVIFFRKDFQGWLVVTNAMAMITGYAGNSVVFDLLDSKKPKYKNDDAATDLDG